MEKTIRCLLIEELRRLLSGEHQMVHALPKMIEAAESKQLKKAFSSHLKETRKQVRRLEKIFRLMKIQKGPKFCKAVRSLILESKEVLVEHRKQSALRDASLISKAQRIEHYEISAYGTAHAFAKELKLYEVASLLHETLEEECGADSELTRIAKGWILHTGVNYKARIAGERESNMHDRSDFFRMMRHFQKMGKAA